jgi:hypothetical protein
MKMSQQEAVLTIDDAPSCGQENDYRRASGHVMNVLDTTGHTTITWDTRDPASVNDARAKFDEMIGRGYSAFAMEVVEDDGVVVEEKGRRIDEFDPSDGKVMMIPQLRGG